MLVVDGGESLSSRTCASSRRSARPAVRWSSRSTSGTSSARSVATTSTARSSATSCRCSGPRGSTSPPRPAGTSTASCPRSTGPWRARRPHHHRAAQQLPGSPHRRAPAPGALGQAAQDHVRHPGLDGPADVRAVHLGQARGATSATSSVVSARSSGSSARRSQLSSACGRSASARCHLFHLPPNPQYECPHIPDPPTPTVNDPPVPPTPQPIQPPSPRTPPPHPSGGRDRQHGATWRLRGAHRRTRAPHPCAPPRQSPSCSSACCWRRPGRADAWTTVPRPRAGGGGAIAGTSCAEFPDDNWWHADVRHCRSTAAASSGSRTCRRASTCTPTSGHRRRRTRLRHPDHGRGSQASQGQGAFQLRVRERPGALPARLGQPDRGRTASTATGT